MQKVAILLVFLATLGSTDNPSTLKGKWNYAGGWFNHKLSAAPKGYTQQRKYTDQKFDAFVYQKGEKDMKYESGTYTLQGDTCLETQTYCLQDQKMVGVTVHYHYEVRKDTLVLSGTLPNGALIQDYWVKVK
ncbi:hypothetical protein [Mucilaginibacter sp. dw_454]|uniref:hypothetical protein n=1 Tax=Mucilaginibacter sp. dw_454 TaxID=2720079 RepID=UPI001BD24C6A|nr:hypothetical protein [Mucilaginibacter sp. dw_454]